jgi:hypothetical protein
MTIIVFFWANSQIVATEIDSSPSSTNDFFKILKKVTIF